MSGIVDNLKSMAESVAWPNKEEKVGRGEHDAALGVNANHESPAGLYDQLRGENGLRNMKTQGNIGQGHDTGLKQKAVNHQEELAERSRLHREGLFEPHMKHEDLVNKSDRHREVARGLSTLGGGDGESGASATGQSDERLV